ncbi:enoyl-CoA hydratase/isomerase family protein [Haloarcula marina]|uniref:enoyl-CoA hydratase/isomerase family protein n=1 Tax=Haloarcula marina TaxID=2961574 RepID=UPI0020B8AF02|nr:enoyl-CoA hydratase/isomerase family protein [Halomicroarcula marina]
MFQQINYEIVGQTAHITIDRPEKLNALLTKTWNELKTALEKAEENDEVRVAILAGNGRAFSSGDDISDLDFESKSDSELWEYTEHILSSMFAIEEVSIPVIAKVDGIAFGGGCEIAALCDITIASENARFRLPEPNLGHVAMVALARFPDLIGLKRTRELLLTSREFSAQEAFEIGLVNEITSSEELNELISERAEQIASTAPLAAKMTKRQLNKNLSNGVDEVTSNMFLFGTEDQKEGVDAFFNNREPEWG